MFAFILSNPCAQARNRVLIITFSPLFLVAYEPSEIGPEYGQNRYGRYISQDPLNSTDMTL